MELQKFNYIQNPEENNEVEEIFNIEMRDDLSIYPDKDIEYIETDSNEIKMVVKHSRYYNIEVTDQQAVNINEILENNIQTGIIIDQILDNAIGIHILQDNTKSMEKLRKTIQDINNKEIKDYSNYKVYVYTSKENIEKIRQN